jgi:hypothetical protein
MTDEAAQSICGISESKSRKASAFFEKMNHAFLWKNCESPVKAVRVFRSIFSCSLASV